MAQGKSLSQASQQILASYNNYKVNAQTNPATHKASSYSNPSYSVGYLSPATIAGQQSLSDKFGVPTFNYRGSISTVPTIASGGFSDVNVGIGAYSNFNEFAKAAVEKQIAIETTKRQTTGTRTATVEGQVVDLPVTDPYNISKDTYIISNPSDPNRFLVNNPLNPNTNSFDNPQFSATNPDSTLSNLRDTAIKYLPYFAVGIIGLMILGRVIKKI